MSEVKVNKISPRTNCGTTQLGDAGDTITVTGDLKSNSLKPATGTTLTLGASGDTVTLASGASQSGFGRTGTVDWQTGDIKTGNFTAASGEGYFCNTTSGSFTLTLPSGSAGAIVSLQDYNNTFDTNALTVTPASGEKINGGVGSGSIVIGNQGQGITFVYIDATVGWRSVQSNEIDVIGSNFVAATGGTETTCGDFKIHTFTGPGTFTVTAGGSPVGSDKIDYLVVAGGGGGGSGTGPDGGAGGAGGGFRLANSTCMPAPLTSPLANPTALTAATGSFPISIGAGGSGGSGSGAGTQGGSSIFSTITSAGGGQGGNGLNNPGTGGSGGSGGGGHQNSGGSGNTPPVSPPQGNDGGPGASNGGAGGGGAGAAGVCGSPGGNGGGNGGVGSYVLGTGFAGSNGTTGPVSSARYFSGGGGGSQSPGRSPAGGNGSGGSGGGTSGQGGNASDNTGGGAGGKSCSSGVNGGSGIVIIRYKFQ